MLAPLLQTPTAPKGDEVPEGWECVTHVRESGKQYKRYKGPNGEKAQSLKQARVLHAAMPTESTVPEAHFKYCSPQGEAFTDLTKAKASRQGSQQTEGVEGVEGAAGAEGAAGVEGAEGAEGAEGVEGAEGADGADGAEGADWAEWVDGAVGAVGAVEAVETVGSVGVEGLLIVAGVVLAEGEDAPPIVVEAQPNTAIVLAEKDEEAGRSPSSPSTTVRPSATGLQPRVSRLQPSYAQAAAPCVQVAHMVPACPG